VEHEWDPKKSKLNLQKHGVSFEEAKEIFYGSVFTAEDSRKDYGERRFISIGSISNIIFLVVVHTDRLNKMRIISARKANHKEKGLYYEYLKTKN